MRRTVGGQAPLVGVPGTMGGRRRLQTGEPQALPKVHEFGVKGGVSDVRHRVGAHWEWPGLASILTLLSHAG